MITNIKTINNHEKWVHSLLLLNDGRVASCSEDKTIKIFDSKNDYHCDITIEGHREGVISICQLENAKIASCSIDKTIKLWTITEFTYQCDYTFEEAHQEQINKIISIPNNRIVSCSWDTTIKVWNSNNPYNLIQIFKGHNRNVSSIIKLNNHNLLASGSFDSTLRIWNLSTYQCNSIMTNIMCCNHNGLLELNNDRVIEGGKDEIILVNLKTYQIEQRIINKELNIIYSFMKFKNDNALCGCLNGIMVLYDFKANKISFISKAHDYAIKDFLILNSQYFITCSNDKSIKIWSY